MNGEERIETDDTTPLSEQASHWWVVLNSETASAADRREFGDWVSRSPERIAAFLHTERLMRALRRNDIRWPDTPADVLIREAKAMSPVVSISHPNFAPHLKAERAIFDKAAQGAGALFRKRAGFGIAASALVVIAAGWYFFTGPQRYQTALGEQRSVVLNDGSLITLNTASKIEVDLDKERRVIRLVEGEALFRAAHDKTRPFEVIAGTTTVRAVGTQFNVDRRAASTTVTVLEGKVLVDEIPVAAAERVVVKAAKVSAPEHLASVAPAIAWTQRRLVFERRPLGEVVEEFNRYNHQLIVIDSPELREQEVTGVFEANDPDSFATFLSKIPGVEVRKADDDSGAVTARMKQTQ